jgi:AbrB family looped-hinge helix DNA binding protein
MSAATINSKGQITIPKEIRALLDLQSGDRIYFIVGESGEVRFVPVTRDISALKGMITPPEKPVELEEMAATIKKRAGQL